MQAVDLLNKIKNDFHESKSSLIKSELFSNFSHEFLAEHSFVKGLKEKFDPNNINELLILKLKEEFDLSKNSFLNSDLYKTFSPHFTDEKSLSDLQSYRFDNTSVFQDDINSLNEIKNILSNKNSDNGNKNRFKLKH